MARAAAAAEGSHPAAQTVPSQQAADGRLKGTFQSVPAGILVAQGAPVGHHRLVSSRSDMQFAGGDPAHADGLVANVRRRAYLSMAFGLKLQSAVPVALRDQVEPRH